jgi:hypothetical protein
MTNFHSMAERLEQLHSNVHTWVGGTMTTHLSPLDPLFFLHHGFIDKVWFDWKKHNPNNYGWQNCDKTRAFDNDTVVSYPSWSVQELLSNNNRMCVRYIDVRNKTNINVINIPPNNIRDTLANITLDTNWLLRNGFNQSQVDQLLRDVNDQTSIINDQLQLIKQNRSNSTNVPGVGVVPPKSNTSPAISEGYLTTFYLFTTYVFIIFWIAF